MLRNIIMLTLVSASTLSAGVAAAIDTMYSGQTLYQGQQLESANHCFRLAMQNDGNLVLYRNSNNQATWASHTMNSGANRVVMQGDGNFVVYNSNGNAKWASGTNNHRGAWILIQNDGNLVIYSANSWNAIWASNTVTHC
ncbi:lectin [Fluviispira multicolorata]|uniref:Lectin n=1 Tax=Fluviispira multicolorata TaxID=2654512 RepID=A0A833JB99_9BACT|nr:lectin [Fluviispira multicolorata]KAB8029054.1 lectin [Fluviispira multicolorata]